MSFDYGPIIATANRLITRYGRAVQFIAQDNSAADPSKPWSSTTTLGSEITVRAIAVPPASVRKFGLTSLADGTDKDSLLDFGEVTLIIANEGNDLSGYSNVRDLGQIYSVLALQQLRPANDLIISYATLRR